MYTTDFEPYTIPHFNSCTWILFDVSCCYFSNRFSMQLMHMAWVYMVRAIESLLKSKKSKNSNSNNRKYPNSKWLLWSCNESSYFDRNDKCVDVGGKKRWWRQISCRLANETTCMCTFFSSEWVWLNLLNE